MQLPDVSYARSGDVAIAYQVIGGGRPDIVFARGVTGDLVSTWDQPLLVRHVDGLAACGRLLMLDRRGTGLSDRTREVQSPETAMDDIRAVIDTVGSERAVLWTGGTATGIGVLFAATYPDRCAGLILFDPRVKGTRSPDYPWASTEEEWRERLAAVRAGWGERDFLEALAHELAPEVADDDGFREWFVWHMRRSLSPGAAVTSFRAAMDLDVSDVLAAVRVPTLVLPLPSNPGPGHYAADRIRDATVVELPDLEGIYTWVDDDVHRATTSLPGSRVVSSTQRGMGSLRHSTGPRAPCAQQTRSANRSDRSIWRSARACTRASARSATGRSSAWRCRSEHGSPRSPPRARCSSPAPSRISSQAPGWSSRIVASTS
jgi:pimeloyl-ACP methyl ester carboxylesterase